MGGVLGRAGPGCGLPGCGSPAPRPRRWPAGSDGNARAGGVRPRSPEPRTGTAGGNPGPLRYSPGGQRLGCGRGSVPGAARYPAPCSRSAGNPRCAPLVPVPPAFVFSPFAAALPPVLIPVGAVPLPGRFLPGVGVWSSRSGVTKPRSQQPPRPHRYLGAQWGPSASPPGALGCGKHKDKSCLLLNVSSLPDTSLLSEC